MSLLRVAVLLGPLVAAALVRWWLARRAVQRGPQRWLLWVPVAGSALVATRSSLSPGRRAAVLAGGIAASYLALAVAAFALLVAIGTPRWTRYVVERVVPGAAAEGRLAAGDRIVSMDGEPLRVYQGRSLQNRIADGRGRPARFTVQRGGREVVVDITPQPAEGGVHRIGIELQIEDVFERWGVGGALGYAAVHPARLAAQSLRDMWDALTAPAPDEPDFYGPVGIIDLVPVADGRLRLLRSVPLSGWLATLAALGDLAFLLVVALITARRRAIGASRA